MKSLVTVIFGDNTLKVSFEVDTETSKLDDLLDQVWSGMNRGSCHEFPWFLQIRSRSLSVGDFISVVETSHGLQKNIYQIASIGFKRVSTEYMESFMSEIKTRINSGKHPWQAICEVNHLHEKIDC